VDQELSAGLKLYLITDRKLFSTQCSMYLAMEDALEAGVKAVQLREKDLSVRELFHMAVWLRELTKEHGARLFINDRVDVAIASGADGVHLGRSSMPVHAVRNLVGESMIIGVSSHSVQEAREAEEEGADFITLGPVYATPSKLKYGDPVGLNMVKEVKSVGAIPLLAIGGIKPDNAKEVMDSGADGLALITGILASVNIRKATEAILRVLQ
jgi:thiamine-phosphate pyrophosphorylase